MFLLFRKFGTYSALAKLEGGNEREAVAISMGRAPRLSGGLRLISIYNSALQMKWNLTHLANILTYWMLTNTVASSCTSTV